MTEQPVSARKGPYKGLDHYEERDAPLFFGREVERDLVVSNLLAARLTLLYGESGVGKSSLLYAGAVPRLREEPDLAVVIFRSWNGDPVPELAAAIRELAGQELPAREPPLTETIATCTKLLGHDLVIILDQFEEYFVYHPSEDGNGTITAELPRAVNQHELPVSFLISIREDALARLDRFKGRIVNLFGNYLRVDRLDQKAGRAAIVRPLEEYGRDRPGDQRVEIEPELVEALLDQVRVGNVELGEAGAGVISGNSTGESRIETPFLQLALTRLWEEELAAGSRLLRLGTLERLGGAERIVPAHLDAAMARFSPGEQDIAARIFRFLVTPSGTKIAHHTSDLADYAEAPVERVEPLLDRLAGPQVRILRGAGNGKYEIYHDVLAAAILDWRARYLRGVREARQRRRRRIGIPAGAVGIAALTFLLTSIFFRSPPPPPWTTGGPVYSSPSAAGGLVYVGSVDSKVYAFNAADGAVRWTYKTGGGIYSTAVLGGGSTLYIGSTDGNVYALRSGSGEVAWVYPTKSSITATPAVANDLLYIGNEDGSVYALHAANGAPAWKFSNGGFKIASSAAVSGNSVYVCSENGKLDALDAQTGQRRWTFDTGASGYCSVVVNQGNGIVYVGGTGGKLFALRPGQHKPYWQKPFSTTGQILALSVWTRGNVLYVASGGKHSAVHALDATTGHPNWAQPVKHLYQSVPTGNGAFVYVGNEAGYVYAIDASGGGIAWRCRIGGEIRSTPRQVSGILYVGNSQGRIYALNPQHGC
jgi:outer membrane protein assembly factor BamB